jgi:hypothetical protein
MTIVKVDPTRRLTCMHRISSEDISCGRPAVATFRDRDGHVEDVCSDHAKLIIRDLQDCLTRGSAR